MNGCDSLRELLYLSIDGLIAKEESEALETHLASCASCRAVQEEIRGIQQRVQGLPTRPAPDGFQDRVLQRLESTRPRASLWSASRWAAAALVLVALGVATVTYWELSSGDETPVASEVAQREPDAATSAPAPPRETFRADSPKELREEMAPLGRVASEGPATASSGNESAPTSDDSLAKKPSTILVDQIEGDQELAESPAARSRENRQSAADLSDLESVSKQESGADSPSSGQKAWDGLQTQQVALQQTQDIPELTQVLQLTLPGSQQEERKKQTAGGRAGLRQPLPLAEQELRIERESPIRYLRVSATGDPKALSMLQDRLPGVQSVVETPALQVGVVGSPPGPVRQALQPWLARGARIEELRFDQEPIPWTAVEPDPSRDQASAAGASPAEVAGEELVSRWVFFLERF